MTSGSESLRNCAHCSRVIQCITFSDERKMESQATLAESMKKPTRLEESRAAIADVVMQTAQIDFIAFVFPFVCVCVRGSVLVRCYLVTCIEQKVEMHVAHFATVQRISIHVRCVAALVMQRARWGPACLPISEIICSAPPIGFGEQANSSPAQRRQLSFDLIVKCSPLPERKCVQLNGWHTENSSSYQLLAQKNANNRRQGKGKQKVPAVHSICYMHYSI